MKLGDMKGHDGICVFDPHGLVIFSLVMGACMHITTYAHAHTCTHIATSDDGCIIGPLYYMFAG